MNKLNCQKIFSRIKDIKSKKTLFFDEFKKDNIDYCVGIKADLLRMIDELKIEIWPLEILDHREFEKQYNQWQEMYSDLGSEYKIPTRERIITFLREDSEFIELMKIKETQGLTKLIIAPAPGFYKLKDFADSLE